MTRPFIDTNVFLYLLSANEQKANRAEAVVAEGGIVSVQVLNELVAVCRRKFKLDWIDIDEFLAAVQQACTVVPLTTDTHAEAVRLAKRYGLSFYDAHICAAALLHGATHLLSEDLQHGQQLDGLTIINPFA